jgi:hypothetical protein
MTVNIHFSKFYLKYCENSIKSKFTVEYNISFEPLSKIMYSRKNHTELFQAGI